MPNDGEPDPETAVGPGRRAVRLLEPVEDRREEPRGDALPAVGDADLEVRPQPGEAYGDASARRRELDRVGDQVPHDLLEPVGIADQLVLAVDEVPFEPDLDFLGLR